MRVSRIGVESILDHVMVDRRKLHCRKLADLLVNDMKFVSVVSLDDFGFEFGVLAKNPAVEASELFVRHAVRRWIEVVKVRELVTQGVADDAIGLGDFVDPFLANDDVVAEVLRSD